MKIKNMEALLVIKNYSKYLLEANFQMDVIALYKIRKNMQKVEIAYKPCGDALNDIIQQKKTDEEKQKDIDNLMNQEIEVDIEKIPVSVFDGIKASPAFVNLIFFMLE